MGGLFEKKTLDTSHFNVIYKNKTYAHKSYLESQKMWGNYFLSEYYTFLCQVMHSIMILKFFTKLIGFIALFARFYVRTVITVMYFILHQNKTELNSLINMRFLDRCVCIGYCIQVTVKACWPLLLLQY